MAVNDMWKTCFQVYRTPEGEFRAFLQAENPRRVRTVLLPVSNRRAAGLLAARLGEEFAIPCRKSWHDPVRPLRVHRTANQTTVKEKSMAPPTFFQNSSK